MNIVFQVYFNGCKVGLRLCQGKQGNCYVRATVVSGQIGQLLCQGKQGNCCVRAIGATVVLGQIGQLLCQGKQGNCCVRANRATVVALGQTHIHTLFDFDIHSLTTEGNISIILKNTLYHETRCCCKLIEFFKLILVEYSQC